MSNIIDNNIIIKAINSHRILFLAPDNRAKMAVLSDVLHGEFLELVYQVLTTVEIDDRGDYYQSSASDYINKLSDEYSLNCESFEQYILESTFEVLMRNIRDKSLVANGQKFYIEKVRDVFNGFKEIAKSFLEHKIYELNFNSCNFLKSVNGYEFADIESKFIECDPFRSSRTFLYRSGKFIQRELESFTNEFYGFEGVQKIFKEHFHQFANGKNGNVPLLISSLPGHGKTQMTISYTLCEENLILIFAEPSSLTDDFPNLIKKLAARSDHKFVLFFDDIVPDDIDWYFFKNYVGGSFVFPDNILIVLASNYHFGASLLSRGRGLLFPIFDEMRCMDMVEGFLISCHLRKPKNNLLSLIAADYTEHFGQKRFSELSPRTLMRYLEVYRTDLNKRKTMLNLSMGDLITRVDASLFYDFNIDLMRKLYGNEYIENLLKEKLRNLEK